MIEAHIHVNGRPVGVHTVSTDDLLRFIRRAIDRWCDTSEMDPNDLVVAVTELDHRLCMKGDLPAEWERA